MKKVIVLIAFAIFSVNHLNAQNSNFGLTGGLFLGSANVSLAGYDINEISDAIKVRDGAGFYVGLLGNFMLTEKFYAQPEVLYTNIDGDGGIVIPLLAKYYIAEQFNLQAGPQFEFLLDVSDIEDIAIKKSGVSLALGAGFDINDKFAVQATYNIGLTDYIDTNISDLIPDDIIGSILNPELKINSFKVGLVYKFN